MFRRSLALLALTASASAAAAAQAMACCGCAYACAPPAPAQTWGLSPSYGVNQGPVYSGSGYYTAPTYEGEASTADYPYVGYGDYRRYDFPHADPLQHRLYYPYWQPTPRERPRHFGTLYRHDTGVVYRYGYGPGAITMSRAGRFRRELRDPRVQ